MKLTVLWQRPAVRFVCAGSAGFGVYYVLLYVLTEYAHWWYLTSSIVALVINYVVTFILQKLLTFRDASTHVLVRQIISYAVMVSGFYLSNVVLLYALVDGLGMWYMSAQMLISALLTVVSFLISRRLFNPKPPVAA